MQPTAKYFKTADEIILISKRFVFWNYIIEGKYIRVIKLIFFLIGFQLLVIGRSQSENRNISCQVKSNSKPMNLY
jgi:hypothetical protein